MLTRLKVNGFKNLVNFEAYFSPFTCIAGVNGVGKSNVFDAIQFLGATARGTLVEAALSVRGMENQDIRSLFHKVGDNYDKEMSFEADMIIPKEGKDNWGKTWIASDTKISYKLILRYVSEQS